MIQAAADAQIEQAAAGAGPCVLLVSDNRDNANWGSRATTMALLELMAAAGLSPSDRVLDAEVRSRVALADGPVAGRLLRQPALARLAVAGLARGGRTRLSLERLGVRDAVSDDPAETVRRWRRSGREPLAEWIARVERADAVVVNGEGSMIFTTPSRLEQRFHLAVMQLAHEADVPFAYVNALVADPANGPRNAATVAATRRLLPQARLVTTRDPWSQAFLREVAPEVASVYVPDSVFAWKGRVGRGRDLLARPEYLTPFHERPDRLGTWDFQRPYICVGGSSEAAKDPKRAAASYRRLLQALPELGYPLVDGELDGRRLPGGAGARAGPAAGAGGHQRHGGHRNPGARRTGSDGPLPPRHPGGLGRRAGRAAGRRLAQDRQRAADARLPRHPRVRRAAHGR